MREIKFRAWDRDRRVMLSGDDIESTMNPNGSHEYYSGLSYGVLFVSYFHYTGDWRECDVMQFTGLHDKNGKEIYEGDILRCVTEKVRVSDNKPTGVFVTKIKLIEWQPEWSRFQFKNTNGNFELLPCTKQGWVSEWYEIIGNIYESFDLLEAT